MSGGIDWAGNGGSDISNSVNGTNPPNVGQGGSKGIDWPGNLGSDVTHTMESTRSPNGPMPGGSGSIQFVGDL